MAWLRATREHARRAKEQLDRIEAQTVEHAARLARLEAEIAPFLPERRHGSDRRSAAT